MSSTQRQQPSWVVVRTTSAIVTNDGLKAMAVRSSHCIEISQNNSCVMWRYCWYYDKTTHRHQSRQTDSHLYYKLRWLQASSADNTFIVFIDRVTLSRLILLLSQWLWSTLLSPSTSSSTPPSSTEILLQLYAQFLTATDLSKTSKILQCLIWTFVLRHVITCFFSLNQFQNSDVVVSWGLTDITPQGPRPSRPRPGSSRPRPRLRP